MILNATILVLIFYYVFIFVKKRLILNGLTNQNIFLIFLIFEHLVFTGFAYYQTVTLPNNDAFMYYYNAKTREGLFSYFSLGSSFMVILVYPFVKLGVTLFTLFCISSYISLRAFFLFYEDFLQSKSKIFCILGIPVIQYALLLPSFHYWSSFLGKDSIVFFLLTFLLFQIKKGRYNVPENFVALILIGLIRPYVLFIILTFVCYCVLKSAEVQKRAKFLIISLIVLCSSVLFPFVIKRYLNLKTLSLESFNDKFFKLLNFAKTGNSGINLSETNYIERIWLLFFRPLFFDAKGVSQFLVSCENFALLSFFIFFVFVFFSQKKMSAIIFSRDLQFSIFLGLGIALFISTYIYNLGLASRMRLMFMPLLFYSFQQIASQKLLNFDICRKK